MIKFIVVFIAIQQKFKIFSNWLEKGKRWFFLQKKIKLSEITKIILYAKNTKDLQQDKKIENRKNNISSLETWDYDFWNYINFLFLFH